MSSPDSPAPRALAPVPYDHRVVVGRQRSVAMRKKILRAILRVCSTQLVEPLTIDNVVREANISRGSFYKHFVSLEQAVGVLSRTLSDQAEIDMRPFYALYKAGWQQFAVALRLSLRRSAFDPLWANYVRRLDSWRTGGLVADSMRASLQLGVQDGDFCYEDMDAAFDFVSGAIVQAMSGSASGATLSGAYEDTVIRMLLRALGCTPEICEQGVAFSKERVADCYSDDRAPFMPVIDVFAN